MTNDIHTRALARIIVRINAYYKAHTISAPQWGRLIAAVIGEFRS